MLIHRDWVSSLRTTLHITLITLLVASFFLGCGSKKDTETSMLTTVDTPVTPWNPGQAVPGGSFCQSIAGTPGGADPDGDGLCNDVDANPSDPDSDLDGIADGNDSDGAKKGKKKKKDNDSDDDDELGIGQILSVAAGVTVAAVGAAWATNEIQGQACFVDGVASCLIFDRVDGTERVTFTPKAGSNNKVGFVEAFMKADLSWEYLLSLNLNHSDPVRADITVRMNYTIDPSYTNGSTSMLMMLDMHGSGQCDPADGDFIGAKVTYNDGDGQETHCIDLEALFADNSSTLNAESLEGTFGVSFDKAPESTKMKMDHLDSDIKNDRFAASYQRAESSAKSANNPLIGSWVYSQEAKELFAQREIEASDFQTACESKAGVSGVQAPITECRLLENAFQINACECAIAACKDTLADPKKTDPGAPDVAKQEVAHCEELMDKQTPGSGATS